MKGLVVTVLLGLTMDVTSGLGSIQLIPQYPALNGSVTMSITGITGEIQRVNWFKGPRTEPQSQILAYFPGVNPPLARGRLYRPQFSAFSNGSLHIQNLLITDGGNYIVKVQTDMRQVDLSVTLTVYEPVTKPKITASSTQTKENDPFILTCDALNAVTITWTRRGASISSGTRSFVNNKLLTFSSIKRGDAGEYQCEAQNLVSKVSSDPYTVTVAYGPDKAEIRGRLYVNPGSPITLTCSADSVPPPEYEWKVNGTDSQENTDNYRISNARPEDEGTYTCVVRNPVTLSTATTSVYVNVTTEYKEPTTSSTELPAIIGIAVALLLLFIMAAIIYLLIIKKRRKTSSNGNSKMKASSRNESSENRREDVPVYENVTGAQPKEESSYMGLQFKYEETYTELQR